MDGKRWEVRRTAGHEIHGQSSVYSVEDGKDIAVVYDGKENGPLIAAAPELLDMLTVAVNYFDKNGIDGQDLHVHEMRATIAIANRRA